MAHHIRREAYIMHTSVEPDKGPMGANPASLAGSTPLFSAPNPAGFSMNARLPAGGRQAVLYEYGQPTGPTTTIRQPAKSDGTVGRSYPGSVNPDRRPRRGPKHSVLDTPRCPKGPSSRGCRTAGALGVAARMSKVRLLHGCPLHSLVCCPPGCTQRAGFGRPSTRSAGSSEPPPQIPRRAKSCSSHTSAGWARRSNCHELPERSSV